MSSPSGSFPHPLDLLPRQRVERSEDERDGQQTCFETPAEVEVALADRLDRGLEHLHGLLDLKAVEQRAAEVERDAGPADRVGRERMRLAQVPCRERAVDQALSEAEPVEQLGAVGVLERLVRRAPEIRRGGVGVALGQRAVGRLAERRDPVLDRARPSQQQMRGHLLGRSARLGE